MFAKLRTHRYMKAKGTADEALVEFAGRVQRIARCTKRACVTDPTATAGTCNMTRGHYWALVMLTGTLWKMLSSPNLAGNAL